jgi:hypothetical protein
VDRLCWCRYHAAYLVSFSTALDFLNKESEKRNSAMPGAIQVKIRRNTISVEVLDVTGQLEKIND